MTDIPRERITAAAYRDLPETNQRVKLIDGEIFMSPASRNPHQFVVGRTHIILFGLGRGEDVLSPMDVYLSPVLGADVAVVRLLGAGEQTQAAQSETGNA